MQKLPIGIGFFGLMVLGAYALVVNLLPDTPAFPRVPTSDGMVGGAITHVLGVSDLANYNGDGTVPNTMMLSGITSTGYLRGMICGAGKVWKNLGGGIPTCADKNTLLASLGTVSSYSGTATVYHADGTFETVSSMTGILAGDIVKTNLGSSLTIVFSDLSLLRIDEDSTVSLDTGMLPDGTNIAYAILENGGLWGRVLTETGGYYIGRNDLIVGVRGTSVYFTQHNPTVGIPGRLGAGWKIPKTMTGGIGSFSIIDTASTGSIATIDCIDFTGNRITTNIGTGVIGYFGNMITGCTSVIPPPTATRLRNIIYSDPTYGEKITENTIKDLQYMSNYVYSGTSILSASKKAKIDLEFQRTLPTTFGDLDSICPDDAAGGTTKTLWPSLIGTGIEIHPCQDHHTYFYGDYTHTGDQYKNLFTSGGIITYSSGTMAGPGKPRLVFTGTSLMTKLNENNWTIQMQFTAPTSGTNYLLSLSGASSALRIYYFPSPPLISMNNGTHTVYIPLSIGSKGKISLTKKNGSNYILSNEGIETGVTFSDTINGLYIGQPIGGSFVWNGDLKNIRLQQ